MEQNAELRTAWDFVENTGRSIFLTINSIVPRKVVMPNLVGYSLNEARSELNNRGLTLGKLNYTQDIATNNVLRQTVRDAPSAPATSSSAEARWTSPSDSPPTSSRPPFPR